MCFNLASSASQSDRGIQHRSNSVLNYKSILLFSADRKVCQPEKLMARRRSIVVLLYKCVCAERKYSHFPTVCVDLCVIHLHTYSPTHCKIHICTVLLYFVSTTLIFELFSNLKSLVTIKLHERVS